MASWIQSNAVLNADSKKKLLASSSKKRKSSSGGSRGLGSTSLSLFEEPPTSTISLEEFERFAIDRMHVLRGINDLKTVQNLKGGTSSHRRVSAHALAVWHTCIGVSGCRVGCAGFRHRT